MARANTRGSIARHAQGAAQANDVGLEYVLVSKVDLQFKARLTLIAIYPLVGRIEQLRQVSTACLSVDTAADHRILDSHGIPGVSNSAEAAIWMLDFGLSAAANGVARMYLHEGIGFE
jgi:hypothetical protein